MSNNTNYLTEAIKGRFKPEDENRLNLIFCASFNSSNTFKKTFLKMIDYKSEYDYKEFHCISQYYENIDKKKFVDLVIYADKNQNKSIISIECKIGCKLTSEQLKGYEKMKNVKNTQKIVLVKYYFEIKTQWEIYHWNELYTELFKITKESQTNTDTFIIHNFLNYLKENNMDLPEKIAYADLEELAKLFQKSHLIYLGNKGISISKKVFETAIDFMNVMEFVINKMREDKKLNKKIGTKYGFNSNLARHCEIKNGHLDYLVGIMTYIPLKIIHNEIKYIAFGLYIYKNISTGYKLQIIPTDSREEYCISEVKTYKQTGDYLETTAFKDFIIGTIRKWLDVK